MNSKQTLGFSLCLKAVALKIWKRNKSGGHKKKCLHFLFITQAQVIPSTFVLDRVYVPLLIAPSTMYPLWVLHWGRTLKWEAVDVLPGLSICMQNERIKSCLSGRSRVLLLLGRKSSVGWIYWPVKISSLKEEWEEGENNSPVLGNAQ